MRGIASKIRPEKISLDKHVSTTESRLEWWREARFGMFIHWGLYAIPAGQWKGKSYPGIAEWVMFKARIPVEEYKELAKDFNPAAFDAEAWAQLAQDAGMKYMILTAKHHDGFAMFHSKCHPFNIVDSTPFGRDPVKELADACAKRDIKFGIYYSHAQDWTEPGAAMWDIDHEGVTRPKEDLWDPEHQSGDFDKYLERKVIPQLEELLTNYGSICAVWFDTPLQVIDVKRGVRLKKVVRRYQPDALINGRLSKLDLSDYQSEGDNEIPDRIIKDFWESPATINDTWGYRSDDDNWKSADMILFNLVDIVSKGGNYLLNVGPDATGIIPIPSQDILRTVGQWLKLNGESVYGAGPSYLAPADDIDESWRCTFKNGKYFLHIFDNTKEFFEMPLFETVVKKAYVLEDGAPVSFSAGRDMVGLSLNSVTKRMFHPVICLEC